MLAPDLGGSAVALAVMRAVTQRLLLVRISSTQAVTWYSVARVSLGGVTARAALHRYSMTWMKSIRTCIELSRFVASFWKQWIWWALPSTRASQSRCSSGSR